MKIYQQWLQSCRQADLHAISTDTAARLMAILYEYGNNEGFTFNQKFLADKEYIQDRFGLREMGTPDPKFHTLRQIAMSADKETDKETKDIAGTCQKPTK